MDKEDVKKKERLQYKFEVIVDLSSVVDLERLRTDVVNGVHNKMCERYPLNYASMDAKFLNYKLLKE